MKLKPWKSKKFYTAAVIVIAVLAAMTFAFGNEHQSEKLMAMGTTLVPTGVNNTLNITFSDVTYSTVAPAFEFQRGNYNVNATWTKGTDTNVTNATYLVMQSESSLSAFSQVQYNLASYNKNASYFFMEAKLAANLTDLTGISIVLSDSSPSTPAYLSTANSASAGLGTIVVNIASTGDLTTTANTSSTTYSAGTNSPTTIALSALQFYDLTVYVHKDTSSTDTATVALINPANGAIIGTSTMTGISGVNFSKLDYAAFQFGGCTAFGPALILDWGYFVFAGTSGATVSSSAVMGDATTPYVLGAASGINGAFAPFDPSAANDTQYKQAPNATYVHTNTATGDKDFNLSSSVLSNETAAQLSVGAYNITSKATFGVGNNTSANSTAMVANLTINKENTNSFTADVHISTFNATGIQTAVVNFLKNYTADLATINTGVAYSYKNMSIISYMISNIQTVTNLSASDASAVRDYFDNGFASVLKESNLSLVDTNTTAIVAGAFAGDFYYQGMALVPEIQGNAIINPVTGQKFANLYDAGFAAGAYISGGAVIVPQATIIGWDAGTPIFASGFSFGSFFGGLTSEGTAVEHYLGNGISDLSNIIGSQAKAVTNYVVKPITTSASNTASTISKDISNFKTGVANLTSSIVPAIGTAVNNVETSVKGALGPISGAVSDLSSSLASAKNGIVTAVAAGASGIKSDIYTLGTQIKNGTQGIINTLGAKISATDAVLSSMFTAIKSIPGAISTKLTSVATYLKNSTLSALDTVGSTITGAVNGVKTTVTNAFGDVANKITGAVGYIKNGLNTAWSFITSFGAKLGFILEIVGITISVVVVVGIVLYLYFRKSPAGEVVEGASKL